MIDHAAKIRIGNLSPETVSNSETVLVPVVDKGTYRQNFKRLLPPEIDITFAGLGLIRSSRYELEGKADEIAKGALEFVRKYDFQGLILGGAALGIFNPGLGARIAQVVEIPVVLPVPSVIAALKALSAQKLIVITPWDEGMNAVLKSQLLDDDLMVLSCPLFEDSTPSAGTKVVPEEIFHRVERAFMEAGKAEAIYFQGATLDPIPIIQRLEDRLGVPVIASNPAMLWYVTSLLGHKFSIKNYGTLLRNWPEPLS